MIAYFVGLAALPFLLLLLMLVLQSRPKATNWKARAESAEEILQMLVAINKLAIGARIKGSNFAKAVDKGGPWHPRSLIGHRIDQHARTFSVSFRHASTVLQLRRKR